MTARRFDVPTLRRLRVKAGTVAAPMKCALSSHCSHVPTYVTHLLAYVQVSVGTGVGTGNSGNVGTREAHVSMFKRIGRGAP